MNLVIAKLSPPWRCPRWPSGPLPGPAAAIKMKSALDGKPVAVADVHGEAGSW